MGRVPRKGQLEHSCTCDLVYRDFRTRFLSEWVVPSFICPDNVNSDIRFRGRSPVANLVGFDRGFPRPFHSGSARNRFLKRGLSGGKAMGWDLRAPWAFSLWFLGPGKVSAKTFLLSFWFFLVSDWFFLVSAGRPKP